ncbi:MAG: TIGR00268 family protein, partial [Clostridia bacterium]|nr:TIGR00268 family protein [Clostridia bacterium]
DKPSYACLATRVPTGVPISAAALERVERGEDRLRALGFSDLRLRLAGAGAKLELPQAQLARAVELRKDILSALEEDFSSVALDLKGR